MNTSIRSIAAAAGAAIVGAGALYLYGSEKGQARRKEVRDKGIHAAHRLEQWRERVTSEARARVRGIVEEATAPVADRGTTDERLLERIRSVIGHQVHRIQDVSISVASGVVTLSGKVRSDEHDRVLRATRHVRGIREVRDELVALPIDAPEETCSSHGLRWIAPAGVALATAAGIAFAATHRATGSESQR